MLAGPYPLPPLDVWVFCSCVWFQKKISFSLPLTYPTVCIGRRIELWDVRMPRESMTQAVASADVVSALFSPCGRMLYAATRKRIHQYHMLDSRSLRCVVDTRLALSHAKAPCGAPFSFGCTNEHVYSPVGFGRDVKVFNAQTGHVVGAMDRMHFEHVKAVAVDVSCRVYTAGSDGALIMWSPTSENDAASSLDAGDAWSSSDD